jgi:uncharacterized membrane protein HdeD (DUF308 family)
VTGFIDVPPSSITPTTGTMPASVESEITRTTWLDFACIMLFLVGCLNIIDGLAALRNSAYVADHVLFSSLHAWGWFFLIWGIVQLVAAFAVYRGAGWGIVVALISVFFNAIAHLSAAQAAPIWSITIVVLDVLIIYGLVSQANRPRATS